MQKHGIYVYPHDCTDFTTTGLVGEILPESGQAVFQEEKNGVCQVTIKIPYDQFEKWKACKVGNYLKCLVPVRMPPPLADGEYSDTVELYRVVE
jgi:hypothetical protein